jgi:integrase
MALNKSQIAAAIRATDKEKTLSESAGGKGAGSLLLLLRRGADNQVGATWFAKWKRDGRVVKRRLGTYPDMAPDQAREAFKVAFGEALRAGLDPAAEAPAKPAAPTVADLFRARVDVMKGEGRVSWEEVERALLTGTYNAADALGRDKPAGAVTAGDVAAFLGTIYDRGAKVTADRTRAYLSAAFSWGLRAAHDYKAAPELRRDWGIMANPAAQVQRDGQASAPRDRNLTADEIRGVWRAAPDRAGDVLRLVLATGQRVQEVIRVDGADLDLGARLWRMPAHKTKGRKRPHLVPLPRQAVEILGALKGRHGDGPLFPARGGAAGELIGLASVSRCAARLECCPPFQPRDLRRTWKSRAHDAGVDRFTRDLIQQHAGSDTGSKHYDRADYLPQMREGMAKWEAWLADVLADQPEKLAA